MISTERSTREQVSLVRAVSKLGIASRSEALQLVRDGRVAVNGRKVHNPHVWIDLRTDRIAIDGRAARAAAPFYLMMHKPSGIVTTRSDERGRSTVFDLLPAGTPRVFAVGRLDKDTSGLLLLTNDVRFGNALTDPLHHVPKRYRVTLQHPPHPEHIMLWREGMLLRDGTRLLPALIDFVSTCESELIVTIVEGKNRQIRRMMEETGNKVIALLRCGIGPVDLGTLKEGEVRPLSEQEYHLLATAQAQVPEGKDRRHDPRHKQHR
jgi:23S rRNA pseudouridine2605 synthase